MIKKVFLSILIFTTTSGYLHSQILTVSPGTNLTIKQGTAFFAGNIILTPSADFTLSDINLSRSTVVSHPAVNTYIARVYQFSASSNPFSGTVQINYQDGAELNGLSESSLELNVHTGVSWQVFTSATNDAVNNYVRSSSLTNIQLNELTLAASGFALPLRWRSFTAAKQQENVLLEWSTFSEQNSKYFTIQNSSNGVAWNTLAEVPAAGSSSSVHNYTYLHIAPPAGYNYYRIAERDADGKYSYSLTRKVLFPSTQLHVEIIGNPVINGMLEIKVSLARPGDNPPSLTLYTSDGKLLWTKQTGGGTHSINVSGYAKGTYLLQANEKMIKFLIQ